MSQERRASRSRQSAAELGCRPNALARARNSGESRLIAMLVAYLDNQFYPIVLERQSRILEAKSYQVLLFMTDPGNQDEVEQRILQYQVEGIVMASATLSSDLARECAATGIPVVMFNRYVASSPASSVACDIIEGGRKVANFLVRGGHQGISIIAGAEDSSTNRDREAGFYKGLAEHGVTAFSLAVGGYTFEGAKQAARQLAGAKQKPDAIFVANDHMAFAVMDVVRGELGLRVPRDISIIGYDDVPEASWNACDLTTVSSRLRSKPITKALPQRAIALFAPTTDVAAETIEGASRHRTGDWRQHGLLRGCRSGRGRRCGTGREVEPRRVQCRLRRRSARVDPAGRPNSQTQDRQKQ